MLSFASSDLPRFFPLSCGFSDTFVVPIISHVGDVRKCEKALQKSITPDPKERYCHHVVKQQNATKHLTFSISAEFTVFGDVLARFID